MEKPKESRKGKLKLQKIYQILTEEILNLYLMKF